MMKKKKVCTKNQNDEKVTKKFEDIERKIAANDNAIVSLNKKFRALDFEWRIYEGEYRKYLAKKDRLRKFLWWLCRKITFRSTKLTKKDLIKRTAKKMTRIFYEGGH